MPDPTQIVRENPNGAVTVTVEVPAPDRAGGTSADLPTQADGDGSRSTCDAEPARRVPGFNESAFSGQRVGTYEVLEEIGAGGMGVVYRARHPALNRMVALKMILAAGRATASQLVRFRGEALAVAKLDHPNVVKVFDIGEHDGLPFFAMEYVDGGGLNARVRREPLDPREAAGLTETLARAMDYAHDRGVIHRDLKPANILLAARPHPTRSDRSASGSRPGSRTSATHPDGPPDRAAPFRLADWEPKITDFGLAKQVEDDADHMTRTGAVMGTPNYMAPEQAEGKTKDANHLADVYGLGACLYEFLTGRPPFSGSSVVAVLSQVRSNDPVSPSQLSPGLPKDLETICLKCLQKEPQKRYATAGDLADDLHRYLAGEAIVARPVSTIEKVVRWARRKPREAALWFTAVLLAVVAVAGVTAGYVRAELLNREITQQKEEIEQANAGLTVANAQLAAERDQAEHVQGFFADEWRRISRDIVNRLPSTLGKDREEFAAYLSKSVDRLNRLSAEGAGMAGRLRFATKIMTGDTLMSRRLLGRISDLNDVKAAVDAYTEAEAIGQGLVHADPTSDLARGNLAVVKARLATARIQLSELPAARQDADSALALREDIVRTPHDPGTATIRIFPADAMLSLADSYAQRATWYERAARTGQPDLTPDQAGEARAADLKAARDLRLKALAMAEADPKSFDSEWLQFGRFKDAAAESYLIEAADAAAARKPVEAQKLLNEALKLSGRSVADTATDLPHKGAVAALLFQIGLAYLKANRPADALDWFDRMRSVADAMIKETGPTEDNQHRLYQAYYGLGTVYQLVDRRPLATARFKECVKLADGMARDNPRPRNVWAQMIALARAGYPDRAVAVIQEERLRVDDPATGKFRIPAEFYFNSACAYSLAAHAVGRWASIDKLNPEEAKQRARYLADAWKAVEEALRLNGPQAKEIDSDPDLAFLQAQPGFADRLKEIRTKNGEPVK